MNCGILLLLLAEQTGYWTHTLGAYGSSDIAMNNHCGSNIDFGKGSITSYNYHNSYRCNGLSVRPERVQK
ncbi:MAG: hypothetical protein IJS63_08800 [Bacteroidaceae bacterium]|nr:hypothetical protein [Bacteroidaceae bacterium]